jgi:hypothetical protein
MGRNGFREQIFFIANDLEITPNTIAVAHNSRRQYTYAPPAESDTGLLEVLSRVIYQEYYIAGIDDDARDIQPISAAAKERHQKESRDGHFESRLSDANSTVEGFDYGWTVESIENDGSLCATKGNLTRKVFPGGYINGDLQQSPPLVGQKIHLFRWKEKLATERDYYFAFGQTSGHGTPSGGVRLYFNTSAKGAITLMKLITEKLNHLKVPFDLKCLAAPAGFEARSDNFILYLSREHVNFCFQILPDIHSRVSDHLRNAVPMFTLRIAKGVSFAESPPNVAESFGESRSKVIAAILADLYGQGIAKSEWPTELVARLEQRNFDPDQFHLNPRSKYFYAISSIWT